MMVSLRPILSQEIRDIMTRHLAELGTYIPSSATSIDQIPDRILACLERLSAICQSMPDEVTVELYREASECYDTLQNFLSSMNQAVDAEFKASMAGEIWARASQWRQQVAKHFQLTLPEVWSRIAPAQPDSLVELDNGLYEARWWKPVPMMDIEILRHTDGVSIDTEPFEPQNFAGGLACRFSLSPDQDTGEMD
jgi:hypothetical protein